MAGDGGGVNNDGVAVDSNTTSIDAKRKSVLASFTSAVLEGNTRPRKKIKPGGTFKDKEGQIEPHAEDPDAGFVKNGDFPKGKVF